MNQFSARGDDDTAEIPFSIHTENRNQFQPQSNHQPDFSRAPHVNGDNAMTKSANKPNLKRLTHCPACEALVSRRAHFCPHCGEPDPSRHIQRSQWVSRVIWTIILAGVGWYGYTTLFPMLMKYLN